ncbi:MAG TPA: terminase family protein [Candidatus Binatia bacterium]|nr:terminase family protein [Candidatus Binatia bacterium]
MTWTPHLGSQTEFLRRTEFEVLFGGSAGPGKTDCLVAGVAADIEHPKYRGLLVRRTFPQLQEIIDRCWRTYPAAGGRYRATEKRWEFPSGAIIDLGHMQHEADKYNYQGKEYHRAAIDELTQFTETQYTYLLSRLRSTEPELEPQALSTTNPGGIGHYWVKERFVTITDHGRPYIDPKTGLSRVFIPAKIEDNPTLFENDPAYVQRLEALPEIERMRLRHGIWDAFEGQVFTELSQRLHGCEDFDVPPEWERYCVLDWGYAKPFSVGWYAMDYDGVLYRYREWYGCKREETGESDGADAGLKMQAWEVAKGILDREKGEKIRMRIADPSIFHPHPENRKREARGVTIHEDMTAQGVYFIKADNDRMHGKQQVHKRLKLSTEIDESTGEVTDEQSMFKVFNSCKGFWRTFPQMREDPRNPEDIDTDQEDHVYDEVRYMCMARPIKPKKVERIPAGSFQAERMRLIRAKKYAQRHGVSVDVAYGRVH